MNYIVDLVSKDRTISVENICYMKVDKHESFEENKIDYMLTLYCNYFPQLQENDYFASMVIKAGLSELSIKGVYVVEIIKLYSGSKIILSGVN